MPCNRNRNYTYRTWNAANVTKRPLTVKHFPLGPAGGCVCGLSVPPDSPHWRRLSVYIRQACSRLKYAHYSHVKAGKVTVRRCEYPFSSPLSLFAEEYVTCDCGWSSPPARRPHWAALEEALVEHLLDHARRLLKGDRHGKAENQEQEGMAS
jgi:hypothetical protein